MERIDKMSAGHCVNDALELKCLCPGKERFLCAVYDPECACFPLHEFTMTPYNIKSNETLLHVWQSMCTIVPVVYFFAMARVVGQRLPSSIRKKSGLRFAAEFTLIVLPSVLFVNVMNDVAKYFVLMMSVITLILLAGFWKQGKTRRFDLGGQRPYTLTLVRTTINFLTALCILAVDFESFPKEFRKSRRYGAGLMDTGIGLFVSAMGAVSRTPQKLSHMTRMLRIVLPLLILGTARTIVISSIDYHQDEHEYGVHLNAFFTLGLTKLLGTAVSAIARSHAQLIPLGLAVLGIHEFALQIGVSSYVMDVHVDRVTLLDANREGICSLPGYVALYIFSMYYGQWLQTKTALTWQEFMHKLKVLSVSALYIWTLLVASIFTVGIARVTCNFGYVVWVLGIVTLMWLLFIVVFDLILNTIYPIDMECTGMGDAEVLLSATPIAYNKRALPMLVEAINANGLVFFLLGNVLTGAVNIFLNPGERADWESVNILIVYMLIASGVIYLMYRYKLRIA